MDERDQAISPDPDGKAGNSGPDGRFRQGNHASRGNPHHRRTAAWRREWTKAATPEVLQVIIAKLLEAAQAGERWAVQEVLVRTLGRPVEELHHEIESKDAPQRVRVEIQGDWYGNQNRIAELTAQRELTPNA